MGVCLRSIWGAYKAHLIIASFQLWLAINMIMLQSVLSKGISGLVLVVYEHAISTCVLIPLAFFLEKGKRPPISFRILGWGISSSWHCSLLFGLEEFHFGTVHGQAKMWGVLFSVAGALTMVLGTGPTLFKSTLTTTKASIIGGIMLVVGTLGGASWNLLVGILVTGLFYYAQTWSVHKKGPVFTTAFQPLLIVFSFILEATVLKESTHLGSIIGAVLVVLGLYMLLWGKSKDQDKEGKEILETDGNINSPLII